MITLQRIYNCKKNSDSCKSSDTNVTLLTPFYTPCKRAVRETPESHVPRYEFTVFTGVNLHVNRFLQSTPLLYRGGIGRPCKSKEKERAR